MKYIKSQYGSFVVTVGTLVANPAHWTPNTNSVAVSNGISQVVVTASSGKLFFRLSETNR